MAGDGCRAGLSKAARAQPRQWPRLCRAALLHRFCRLLKSSAAACPISSVCLAERDLFPSHPGKGDRSASRPLPVLEERGASGSHPALSGQADVPGETPAAAATDGNRGGQAGAWGQDTAHTPAPSLLLLRAALARKQRSGCSLSHALLSASIASPPGQPGQHTSDSQQQTEQLPQVAEPEREARTATTALPPVPEPAPAFASAAALSADRLKAAAAALRACPYGEVKAACGALSGSAQAWQQALSPPSPFERWIPKPPQLSEFVAQTLHEALGA